MKSTLKIILLFTVIAVLQACATTNTTTSSNTRNLSVSGHPYAGGPAFGGH